MFDVSSEQATSLQPPALSPMRQFIDQYFEAWGQGVAERILEYFAEDIVINMWSTEVLLIGKQMVNKHWVVPTVNNYPDNIHQIQNFLEVDNQVVVEWIFRAVHAATGKAISLPGCSVYRVSGGLIQRGDIYFSRPQSKQEHGPGS